MNRFCDEKLVIFELNLIVMKKITLLVMTCITAFSFTSRAQERKSVYSKSAYEYIFSWGDVKDGTGNYTVAPVVRFSGFINSQEQFHFDMSNTFGLYTGIGVRNIGFINKFSDTISGGRTDITVKQRQYALGVPLALKVGSMSKNIYLAVGAEMELFFNYKQKVFYNNTKNKGSEWFSNNSKIFNPSLFAEVNFPKGQFIRFRYYLNDFLLKNQNGIPVPSGEPLKYYSNPSSLMYISIGTALDWDAVFEKSSNKNPLKASLN